VNDGSEHDPFKSENEMGQKALAQKEARERAARLRLASCNDDEFEDGEI
jgi:hypothetical protein